MAGRALGVILLLVSATSASWFTAESEELRHDVFEYCKYLSMDQVKKNYACFGENVLLYGYGSSGCLDEQMGKEVRKEAETTLDGVLAEADMLPGIVKFYNHFLLGEKHDKDLILSMTTYYIKDHLSCKPDNGHYVLEHGEVKLRFPESPKLPVIQKDCEKIKLFLARLRYRLDNFHVQLEPNILMTFALSNFPGANKEIGGDEQKKLRDVTASLKTTLKSNGEAAEHGLCAFLLLRSKTEELLVQDVAAASDPAQKVELQKELDFHQLITHMMLHGWMKVTDTTPKDGKITLTGFDKKAHEYVVPEN